MKLFKLNKDYTVVCEWKKTRMAFKHEATLMKNGAPVEFSKVCYQNRTWESYEFQTVAINVIDKYFDKKQAKKHTKKLDVIAKGEESKRFGPLKAICVLGNLLCDTSGEKADWKKRMIGTVPGIDFPDDFDQLSDEERNKRLDGALNTLTPRE